MTSEQLNPRELLAKLEAEEAAKREEFEKQAAANRAQRDELLKQMRQDDLDDVREKCRLHGFTQTDLRGFLKTKGGGKRASATKSVAKKSTARKAT